MNTIDKRNDRTNSAKTSATTARTTEPAVTTYRNALEATGVNVLDWLEKSHPTRDEAQNEWHNLIGYLAESYDLIDEDGEPIDFFSAYVTDATAEQAQQLRNNYDTIYIAYSAELDKYVLLTTWWGCSMEQIPVRKRTTDKGQYLLSHLGGELQWTNFAPSVVEYIARYVGDDILTDLQEYSRDGLIDHNYPYDIFDQYGPEMEAYLLNEYGLTDLTPEACMCLIVQLVIDDLIDALEDAQEYTDNSTQVA